MIQKDKNLEPGAGSREGIRLGRAFQRPSSSYQACEDLPAEGQP